MLKVLLIALLALGGVNNQLPVQVQAHQRADNDSWAVELTDWLRGRTYIDTISFLSNQWLDAMHISSYERARILGRAIRLEAERKEAQSMLKISRAVALDNQPYRDGQKKQKAFKFSDEDHRESE